jgi:Na+/proline symporter/signal transduction histidine kinase
MSTLSGSLVVVTAFLYLGVLFGVAAWADRRADEGRSVINSATVYSLSLAVYCTTWTYYGSVGRAAVSGIGFLPIYLGPTLAAALWWFVLAKMIRIAKANRITSIADFISSRYGKSYQLGALVTVIAVIGIVPYIALQLKAMSTSFAVLVGKPSIALAEGEALAGSVLGSLLGDHTLYITLLLALFIIFFGTRHLDAAERHEGMVAAIALESIVKLVAFMAVGLFVAYGLFDGVGDIFRRASEDPALRKLLAVDGGGIKPANWFSLTLLSVFAIMFLPRQFQIAVVENVSESHVRRAVWMFPLYLLLINLFVLPIALGGKLLFAGQAVDADTYVLTLPLAHGHEALALFVFIGGLSAATGMVIVETIALSTMVCNDLVMPALLRTGLLARSGQQDLSPLLLLIRRASIVVVMLMGYAYFRIASEAYALVAIGLISFAAVAQFAPAMIGGLYWRSGRRAGAMAGLLVGFGIWAYTLLIPSFAKSGWLPAEFLQTGPFGIGLLRPQQLFGLTGLDEITHCLFWSLLGNVVAFVGVSLRKQPDAQESRQASLFVVDPGRTRDTGRAWRGTANVAELYELNSRFLGRERAREAFTEYARRRGVADFLACPADADCVHFAETLLAGAIGSASARVMVASVVTEEPLGFDEVMNILDEASQVRAYSHQLEEKSKALEAATQELREANERMRELDRLKDNFMSSVTHELRTPLTSIRALSEILLDDPDLPLDDRKQFLSVVVAETERLTRLVNEILDLAKLESGTTVWNIERIDFREVVSHSAAATRQLFVDKKVGIEVSMPEAPAIAEVDRDRAVQVVINLLSNAVKFVDAGAGKVDVSLVVDASGLVVSVVDNGPGVRREDHALIFERFRQVGDVMTDKPSGTGLGLPISRQIVERFGGRLWVESDPESGRRGSTFRFTLPLCADH